MLPRFHGDTIVRHTVVFKVDLFFFKQPLNSYQMCFVWDLLDVFRYLRQNSLENVCCFLFK